MLFPSREMQERQTSYTVVLGTPNGVVSRIDRCSSQRPLPGDQRAARIPELLHGNQCDAQQAHSNEHRGDSPESIILTAIRRALTPVPDSRAWSEA